MNVSYFLVFVFVCCMVLNGLHAMDFESLNKILVHKKPSANNLNKAIVKNLLNFPWTFGAVYRSVCLEAEKQNGQKLILDPQFEKMCQLMKPNPANGIHGQQFKGLMSAITPDMFIKLACNDALIYRTRRNQVDELDRQVRLLLKLTDGDIEKDGVLSIADVETIEDDDDTTEEKRPHLGVAFLDVCYAMRRSTEISLNDAVHQPITGKDMFRITCSRAFKSKPKPKKDVGDDKMNSLLDFMLGIRSVKTDAVTEALRRFCRVLFNKNKRSN